MSEGPKVNIEKPRHRCHGPGRGRQEGADSMDRTCTVEGCAQPHYGRGYCRAHWKKWRRTGSPTPDTTHRNKGHRFATNTGRTRFQKGQAAWNKGQRKAEPYRATRTFVCTVCGAEFTRSNKARRSIKTCSKACWSEAQKGAAHPMWKGGIYPEHQRIRRSQQYRAWRAAVLRRDGYACQQCGQAKRLQADHIKPFAKYPELRFDIDNGRTLCEPCHRSTPTFGGRTK